MNKQEIIDVTEENCFHVYNRFDVVFERGEGVTLYDTDGKEYLDFASGIGVMALGYNNKDFNDAIKAQVDKLYHTYGVKFNRYEIKAKILQGTSMYFSDITEKLYADYEIYFDEI